LAYGGREHDRLAQISDALSNHRSFETIGAYYRGLAAMRSGRGDLHAARCLLEQAADGTQATYRAKALLSLGAVAWYQQNFSIELNYYRDALNIQRADISTRLELNRAIAFNYTEAGEYHRAIALLESIAPVARAAARINPRLYYDLLNNYAVNLCAVGRLKEALYYASFITASSLARHIPEWRETKAEITDAIAEQEAPPLIVAVQQVRAEEKGEAKPGPKLLDNQIISQLSHGVTIDARKPVTQCYWFSLVQTRLRHSIQPHAPPSPFWK
jgi:tetratricopeptide (TPR) repeat protein